MTTSNERPTARSRPRPAEDEGIDPIAPPPPGPDHPGIAGVARRAVEAQARRGPEPTVQLNVRVASDISALIDHQVSATGRTKRQLIEHAVRQAYS